MTRFHIFLTLAAYGIALAQPAAAAPASCQAALQRLDARWDSVGFTTPSKPMQALVVARNGRVASGAEITYLTSQIRQAAADCAAGRDEAGLQRIALVQARLD